PGYRDDHMVRATSPWRSLTPPAYRDRRRASVVIPKPSAGSSPAVPRARNRSGSMPSDDGTSPSTSRITSGGQVSFPAGNGVAVGVEQVQRDPAHVDPPHRRRHLTAPDGDGDGEGLVVVARDRHGGQELGIGLHPVVVLPPVRVEALVVAALRVEDPHPDEGQ